MKKFVRALKITKKEKSIFPISFLKQIMQPLHYL